MDRKPRILLADDSRFFRAIEERFLQNIPVMILEAGNCDAVMETMRNNKPDLVYMAFSLPEGGGDLCCRVIKEDGAWSATPVVLICEKDKPEQMQAALRAGCDACLVKPLDRHSFLQAGRKFLSGIREHRQQLFFTVTFSVMGQRFNGNCLDLSGGGMFIDSKTDFDSGTPLELSFNLPDDASTRINCKAEISWPNRTPNPLKPHYPHGFGVRFLGLSPADYKAILRLSDKNPFA